MALSYDLSECDFNKEGRTANWNTIQEVIFLTMAIDIGHFTEKNIGKVEFRIRCYCRVINTPLEDIERVLSMLPKLIGLKTNVTDKTDKAFERKMALMLSDEIRRNIRLKEQARLDS